MGWDKELAYQLRELGLSNEFAMKVVGLVAEHRQQCDREGYERGYNNGYRDAAIRADRNPKED